LTLAGARGLTRRRQSLPAAAVGARRAPTRMPRTATSSCRVLASTGAQRDVAPPRRAHRVSTRPVTRPQLTVVWISLDDAALAAPAVLFGVTGSRSRTRIRSSGPFSGRVEAQEAVEFVPADVRVNRRRTFAPNSDCRYCYKNTAGARPALQCRRWSVKSRNRGLGTGGRCRLDERPGVALSGASALRGGRR
jgi:hypothetical protein